VYRVVIQNCFYFSIIMLVVNVRTVVKGCR
jgi:hypothetical protein